MKHPFNQGNPNKNIRVIYYIRVRSLSNPSSNETSVLSIVSVFAHFLSTSVFNSSLPYQNRYPVYSG